MNTLSGEERAALRDSVHRLLQDQSSEAAVRAVMETDSGYDPALWRSLAEMGVVGLIIDEAHGGSGVGPMELEAVMEEAGAALLCSPLLASVIAARLLQALGDEAGAGVFVDPRSGEVLAMVSTPTYDPNMFARGVTHKEWGRIQNDPRRPLHDRTIDSFYAPGSTFKVLMAVAGIETGEVTPDHRVFCNGSATYYGRRRLCWKRGGHGWVDLRKALAKSCNVYFYQLGKDMGIDEIHRYGWMFGLGQPSGASIPGEETGILPSREWKQRSLKEIWYPGDTISVSIGQGLLAVTPVQMVRMISTVATGGRRPDLRLVGGKPPKSQAVAVNPMTFKLVNLALEDAVNDGTAKTAAVRGIQVAGKTGTAQVFKHSAGIDADELPKAERDHAWLVGYAPSDHPTIAFAIVVEHGGHGGTSAAPIARDVLTEFFYPSEPATEEADESLRVSRPVGAGRIDGLRPPAAR